MTASLHVELQPNELALAPAQPASVGVRVVNTGSETLELILRVAGLDAPGAPSGARSAHSPRARR